MNQSQHSFARLAPSRRSANGSRGGSLLPTPAATLSRNHVQRDSRSLRGARTPWGWRCYGYLPVRVADLRVQDVVLPTGRGFGPGTFFGTRSDCNRPVANINSMSCQHSVDYVAKPLKCHFIRSKPLPIRPLGKPSYGETRDVGPFTQEFRND